MKKYKRKFEETEINYAGAVAAIEKSYKLLKDKNKELENLKNKKKQIKGDSTKFDDMIKEVEEDMEKILSGIAMTPDIRKFMK